ncbi:hypothetical protein DL93DRAFT_2087285 [Clavulina sp. PMI_390]|nr:hypothetical protein DL93DRAFT_2087285 [Clavulina sp. PMI_390]
MSFFRKGRRWMAGAAGNSTGASNQGVTASMAESNNVNRTPTVQEEHVPLVGDDGPPPNYDGPSSELMEKLHELSHDEAITDDSVRRKVKEAIEMAPTISVVAPVPRDMRDRAAQFRELIDSIDTFLEEPLERFDDMVLIRTEALRIQRALAFGTRRGSQTHADLARFARNLALALHKKKENDEACVLDEEALAIRRECFKVRPGAERPYLAKVLHSYSIHLHAEERYKEALAASEEAVQLQRLLYELDPDEAMDGLAMALRDCGIRLSSVQRFEEAKATEEEGLVLWRLLYQKNPGKYRSLLDQALTNYIVSLKDLALVPEVKAARAERDEIRGVVAQ